MLNTRFIPAAAVALLSLGRSLGAQGTKQTVELAFGYECGDRFLVRNDGAQPVVIEYAVTGSEDKSQLHLNGKQSAEIASAQSGDMQLWVSGKVVATEPKGNLACRGAPQNNDGVMVRPLNQSNNDTAAAETTEPGYSAPPVVVYAGSDYYPNYYPYYYPSYYGYYGYYGYPSLSFSSRIGIGFGRGIGAVGRGYGGIGHGIGGIGRGRPVGRGRGRR